MSTQIQRRRGTTAQHASFTGVVGETTVDTDKDTVVVHDGTTVGGHPLMRENGSNSALALGSAATPSLKFTGDTNTGIYSPGADQVAISTGGSGRLFVDASGNIGLGISSFTTYGATQHVTALGASAASRLSFYNGSTLTGDIVSANFASIGLQLNVPNAYPIQFFTDNQERLRITSAGLVGVGTSSPSYTLDVAGSIRSTGGTTALRLENTSNAGIYQTFSRPNKSYIAALDINNNGGKDFTLYDATAAAARITISDTGAVGIGTSSPSFVLDVAGGAGNGIRYQNTANSIGALLGASSSSAQIGTTTAHPVEFLVGSVERARIDTSGRLLVGTSTASNNLRLDQKFAITSTATGTNTGMAITQYSGTTSTAAPIIEIQRSRGTSDGSFTEVITDDLLGAITFRGADGAGWSEAANITAWADGDWTTSGDTTDGPGRLVFSTTADGASSPTERMRLTSTGQLRLAGAGITFNGDTATANELDDYEEGTWTPVYSGTWTTTPTNSSARYTKIGRLVHIAFSFTGGAKSSATSGWVTGLPFASQGATDAGGGTGRLSDTSVSDRGLIVLYDNRLFLTATTFDAATNYCDAVYIVA